MPRRQWWRAALAIAVVAAGIGLPFAEPGVDEVPAAIPDRLHVPPIYTPGVTMSPPGPAAVIFRGAATTDNFNEGRFAVVAASADRYRVSNEFPGTWPGVDALLSPDGRLITAQKGVVDLSTGKVVLRYGDEEQLGFAPVSNRVMTVQWTVETQPSHPRKVDRITVQDPDGAAPPVRVELGGVPMLAQSGSAALSVDDRRLAVAVPGEVRIYDLPVGGGAATLAGSFAVPASTTLAGGGAWRPDGAAVATLEWEEDRWSIIERGVRDGRVLGSGRRSADAFPEPRPGEDVHVIGWRSTDVLLAVIGPSQPVDDRDNARARLVELHRGDAESRVLLETPRGVSHLDVAARLALAGAFRRAGSPSYLPVPRRAIAFTICLAAAIAWVVYRLARRARRRRERVGAQQRDDGLELVRTPRGPG